MSGPTPTKRYLFLLGAIVASGFIIFYASKASSELKRPEYGCTDLLIVFARGSGQNSNSKFIDEPLSPAFAEAERESYSFFSRFKAHIDVEYPNIDYKAVSIHDFPGKYSPVGYRAAEVGHESIQKINNSVNGELFWAAGSYRASVEQGIIETVGYIKDQISDCPDQSIVVGGYSQGAQVMGESLFQLTEQERSKIVGVGLFGDPKYIGSTGDDLLNPLDKAVSFPWRRGTATNNDRGMLDPRIPYLPSDIERRAASWCFARDMVCSGWSAYAGSTAEAHQSYAQNPITDTVNEIMQWAGPKLAEAERRRGGFGSGPTDPYAPTPAQKAKSRDIMFLLNDDSGDTVLQTFRYGLDEVLDPITKQYTNTQYGAKGFGEGQSGTMNLPRVNNIQALLPYVGYDSNKPGQSLSNFARSINNRYPFAQPQMGGGDFADPHGLAVEKSVFSGGWRPEAEKHLVLITDRAPKENYTYNICNATVRSWLQIPQTDGNKACVSELGSDNWPKVQHPEICETIYLAITTETCTNPLKTPGYFQFNKRTLEDAIKVAQSQNIHVSVVVPYKIVDQYNINDIPAMMRNLRYLAEATGGKFINYDLRDKYSGVLLSDTLRQIFTHEPKSLVASYEQAYDNRQSFSRGIAAVATNTPVILDVSQSGERYEQYKWDTDGNGTWDQITDGPVTEVVYGDSFKGFTKVLGVNTDGSTAQTNIPVDASVQDILDSPAQLEVPAVTGAYNANGSLTLTWSSGQGGNLMFVDPESRLPVAATSISNGSITFIPEESYDQLLLYAVLDDTVSEPVTVSLQAYVPPVEEPEEEPESGETDGTVAETPDTPIDDPTMCYKLQTCQKETNPNQEIILTAATNNVSETTPQIQGAGTVQNSFVASEPEGGENASSPRVAAATTASGDALPVSKAATNIAQGSKGNSWLKLLTVLTILVATVGSIVGGVRKYQRQ